MLKQENWRKETKREENKQNTCVPLQLKNEIQTLMLLTIIWYKEKQSHSESVEISETYFIPI
jgi:hypothetical protein